MGWENALGGEVKALSEINERSGARTTLGVSSKEGRWPLFSLEGSTMTVAGFRGYKISSPPLSSAMEGFVRKGRGGGSMFGI